MVDSQLEGTAKLPAIAENGRPSVFSGNQDNVDSDSANNNNTEIDEPSVHDSSFSIDSPSISLNGDLLSADTRSTTSIKTNSNVHHIRKVSDASFSLLTPTISTSNYNTSSVSLGINNLSATSVSPLGQNSIYELIENAQYRSKATSTGYLTTMSSPGQINIRGPTTRDIPAVKLSKISKIKDQQFMPYLNTVSDSFKQFESHKTLTQSTLEAYMAQLNREDKKKGLSRNSKLLQSSKNLDKGRSSEINSSTMTGATINETATVIGDDMNQRKYDYAEEVNNFGIQTLESAELISNSLDKIPKIFFLDDFRLDDPRVFNEVIGNKKILQETIDYNGEGEQKSVVDNDILQERFSSYLDIIEIHLIHEISKSSGSFFAALGDLKEITESSDHLTKKMNIIDHKLASLADEKVFPMASILQMVRKRNNIARLEQSLLQVSTIMHQADMAESSYFNANYDKVLELTGAVLALIKGDKSNEIVSQLTNKWHYPLINMDSLSALSPLKRLLSNLISDTGKSFAKLFCDYLIDDLRNVYENSSKTEVVERMARNLNHGGSKTFTKQTSGDKSNYQKVESGFKSGLEKYVRGLIRCNEITSAYRAYEDRFSLEMKTIIRSFLSPEKVETIDRSGTSISGLSGDSRTTTSRLQRGHSLGAMIRALTPKEFEDTLLNIYTQISEALRRLTVHQKLLLEIALDGISDGATAAIANKLHPELIVQLDITDAITSAIEISQRRMAKIMNARELQNSCVTLDYFLRLYFLNTMFLEECELISGGRLVNPVLQDIIRVQFQKFYTQYHHASMKILSGKVEKEIWRECSLPKHLQILTNQEISAGNDDFDESVWMDPMNLNFKIRDDSKKRKGSDEVPGERKTLTIGEESFIVPNVVGSILEMLQHYEIIKMQFRYVDGSRIIELLKLLNLKIHQSVLGAQATRTAGLRNITSRHLAVTSQLLGFLSELVPHIRSLFERLSKADSFSLYAERFNEIQKLFMNHRTEIFDKLISIMVDRLAAEKTDIQKTDWTYPLPMQKVHTYMESLVSKTLTISRILQRYLPEDEYTHILSQIFDKYKNILTDIYSGVSLKDSVEKAVMMRDIDYFREKLADVSGYSNSGQIIWENVNAMSTEEDSHVIQPDTMNNSKKANTTGLSSVEIKPEDQNTIRMDEGTIEKIPTREETDAQTGKESTMKEMEVNVRSENNGKTEESDISESGSLKITGGDQKHGFEDKDFGKKRIQTQVEADDMKKELKEKDESTESTETSEDKITKIKKKDELTTLDSNTQKTIEKDDLDNGEKTEAKDSLVSNFADKKKKALDGERDIQNTGDVKKERQKLNTADKRGKTDVQVDLDKSTPDEEIFLVSKSTEAGSLEAETAKDVEGRLKDSIFTHAEQDQSSETNSTDLLPDNEYSDDTKDFGVGKKIERKRDDGSSLNKEHSNTEGKETIHLKRNKKKRRKGNKGRRKKK